MLMARRKRSIALPRGTSSWAPENFDGLSDVAAGDRVGSFAQTTQRVEYTAAHRW